MDKSVLIEYADTKEEIKDLRKRIEADRRELRKLNAMVVADTVTLGKKGKKPLGTYKVEGQPIIAISRKQKAWEKKIAQMEEMEADLLEKQNEVEEYIQQIKKSEIRIMFRLYYLDDLPWYKVAIRMNQMFPNRRIKYTEDNCKQKHKRYFDKL